MIKGRKVLGGKNKDNYWQLYFNYRDNSPELHEISKNEIVKLKFGSRFVDSQQLIGAVLNKLSIKHNFHRQFDEKYSFKKNQILGMQLYVIMLEDDLDWEYFETQHYGHANPHATYITAKLS